MLLLVILGQNVIEDESNVNLVTMQMKSHIDGLHINDLVFSKSESGNYLLTLSMSADAQSLAHKLFEERAVSIQLIKDMTDCSDLINQEKFVHHSIQFLDQASKKNFPKWFTEMGFQKNPSDHKCRSNLKNENI